MYTYRISFIVLSMAADEPSEKADGGSKESSDKLGSRTRRKVPSIPGRSGSVSADGNNRQYSVTGSIPIICPILLMHDCFGFLINSTT